VHDLWDAIAEPLAFTFMQRALLAAVVVSIVAAVIGTFVVLKGLAFIGDALAHASFAGVAAAFVLGTSIYLGAVVAAVATALGIGFISRRARVSFDTAIGILFVGAFALGILIVSRQSNYTVDLFDFVFGNILGVSQGDLILIGVMGLLVVGLIALFYKELLFATYDPTMAAAAGVPVALVQYGLLAMLAVATVVALRAVGIVLVVAMLVTPAATASLLVRRVPQIMLLGSVIGIIASVSGLYISYYASVASGAAIVLVATVLFFVALLFAPRRGLLTAALARPSTSGQS
jgi:manganese/iron transport system permease protein